MPEIEIIICTERGYLEALSKFLVSSIRKFGGRFKDVPIFSYQPRKYFKISQETKRFFDQHQVAYIDIPLNREFTYYPLANKPLVCSYHENKSKADILIFLDSDIFFLDEPSLFQLVENCDASLRPLDLSSLSGATSFDTLNGGYWNKIYNLLDVKKMRRITSTVDNKEIFEYYNSGHIISKNTRQLFSHWLDNFLRVMKAEIQLPNGYFYVEQSVLSATITQLELNIHPTPREYNFPIHLLAEIQNEQYKIDSASSLISVHYHKMFLNNTCGNPVEKFLNEHPNGQWVNEKFQSAGIITQTTNQSRIFQKVWNKINQYRSSLG